VNAYQIFIDISMHFAIVTINKTRQGYVSLELIWKNKGLAIMILICG